MINLIKFCETHTCSINILMLFVVTIFIALIMKNNRRALIKLYVLIAKNFRCVLAIRKCSNQRKISLSVLYHKIEALYS